MKPRNLQNDIRGTAMIDDLSSCEVATADAMQDKRDGQGSKPSVLCRVVFIALGLLLIVAAAFKTYQAYSEPMSARSLLVALALICFEVCFGSWLIAGVRTPWAWRAAIACFAVFACVSTYKTLIGAASCGCFGTLQIHPWITLSIDVLAVTLLAWCRNGVELTTETKMRRAFPRVASIAIVLSLLATSVSIFGNSRFVQSNGVETTAGQLVLLEPESWIGKRWPLLVESGLESHLASGGWEVLLFRHDCHVCHDVMIELEQSLLRGSLDTRVALIGIDERRHDALVERLQDLGCLTGFLPQDREWFTTTPLQLRLNRGICVSANVIDSWD